MSVKLNFLVLLELMVNAALMVSATLLGIVLLQLRQQLQQFVYVVLVVLGTFVLVIHAVKISPLHLFNFALNDRLLNLIYITSPC